MDLGLSHRAAIVCAASRGLGRAAAQALAAEGCRVAICGRNAASLQEAAIDISAKTGAEVLPIVADVALEADRERLVRRTIGEWGTVDILVTNTGGPPGGPTDSHHGKVWRESFESLFMSVQGLCGLVVPRMCAQSWGRIINITSITVKQPVDGLAVSNALRPAVVGFAKSLANELGRFNILVNNVCPGYTRTERLIELAAAGSASSGQSQAEIVEGWCRQVPLGRLGEPAELGALVAFLASERASYITGATIPVDGGFIKSLLA